MPFKLTYFNERGLAETARMLFKLADQEFLDVRVEWEDWPQIKRSMLVISCCQLLLELQLSNNIINENLNANCNLGICIITIYYIHWLFQPFQWASYPSLTWMVLIWRRVVLSTDISQDNSVSLNVHQNCYSHGVMIWSLMHIQMVNAMIFHTYSDG